MIPSSTASNMMFEEWALNDDVIRIREWGTDRVFTLFADERGLRTIGTGADCWLRLEDPQRRVSRKHAHIERVHGRWCVIDDGSKSGVYLDGVRRDRAVLVPCAEIGFGGGVTFIAESARSIALRGGLARMLGWGPLHAGAIDLALRAIRLAATRRSILVLCGHQELVPLAAELHRLTLTPARPFVLVHPLRRTPETSMNPVRCVNSGREALAEAPGGTVCLYNKYLPRDLIPLLRDLRIPECQTQLVVCSPDVRDAESFSSSPIVIPPLSSRVAELDRLIDEYLGDAAMFLGMDEIRLTEEERAWIRARSADSLADLQRATLRLGAIHQAGSISRGGNRLGISHVAMLNWMKRRQFLPSWLPASTGSDEKTP